MGNFALTFIIINSYSQLYNYQCRKTHFRPFLFHSIIFKNFRNYKKYKFIFKSHKLVPGLGGLKETKMFLPHPRVKVSIVGSLRDREVACSASDRQGSNFESCVWRTVSSQSSHHPQEVLLTQFSLYVHKGGLKPDSFHFAPGI